VDDVGQAGRDARQAACRNDGHAGRRQEAE
jgi:hypothetical protein